MGGWGSVLLGDNPAHTFIVLLLLFGCRGSSLLRDGLDGSMTPQSHWPFSHHLYYRVWMYRDVLFGDWTLFLRVFSGSAFIGMCSSQPWKTMSLEPSWMGSRELCLSSWGPNYLASPEVSPGGKNPGSRTSKYNNKGLPTKRSPDEFL